MTFPRLATSLHPSILRLLSRRAASPNPSNVRHVRASGTSANLKHRLNHGKHRRQTRHCGVRFMSTLLRGRPHMRSEYPSCLTIHKA